MSNRSLASARQKRSPETIDQKAIQSNINASKNGLSKAQPQSSSLGKISIGDAIGLITIRLSKLEEHRIKQDKGDFSSEKVGDPNNIDNTTLMKSLINRIVDVEKIQERNVDLLNTYDPEKNSNTNTQYDSIYSNIELLNIEVSEIKKALLKLQTMVIDMVVTK